MLVISSPRTCELAREPVIIRECVTRQRVPHYSEMKCIIHYSCRRIYTLAAIQPVSTLEIPTSSVNQSFGEKPRYILFSHLTNDHNSNSKREKIQRKRWQILEHGQTINQPWNFWCFSRALCIVNCVCCHVMNVSYIVVSHWGVCSS